MAPDDLDLNRGDDDVLTLREDEGSRRKWIIAAVIGLALVLGGLARWWTMDRSEPAPAAAAAAADTAPAIPEAPPVILPPLEEMDGFLRVLLGTLSSRPELSRWLATDNLIQQMAIAIDRISKGGTPASELKVLAPSGEFALSRTGRTRTIDPATFRRWDGLTETIATLDAAAMARAYRTIQPRLDDAYRALGRTDTNVDAALAVALDVLARTPVPEGPITLVEGKGATWRFADPALEGLDPAQKQIVRMGPENAARVVAKLTEIRQAVLQPE